MLTLSKARKIIEAAERKADEIGQPMNIAVVDEGGNLSAHVRMDGAWIGSIDISINKACPARANSCKEVEALCTQREVDYMPCPERRPSIEWCSCK